MRIDGKIPLNTITASAGKPAARGARFSLNGSSETSRASASTSVAAPESMDALLAMQEADGVGEREARRRRSVVRGRSLLDALDGLKAALLSGRISATDLARLTTALAQSRETTGDAGLDEVIAHIDLRAQVEFAKLEQARFSMAARKA
jgi:hypothetical protein